MIPESTKPTAQNKLFEHAQQAEKHLEQLATGLSQSGAPEQAVKVVSQMADVVRKMQKELARTEHKPEPAGPPQAAQPPAGPPEQQPRSIGEATNQLAAQTAKRP